MIRFFTWVKHVETAAKAPRRPADIESGASASKTESEVETVVWQAPEKLEEDK